MTLRMRQEGEHPSAHSLTRYHAGEGDQDERARIENHIQDCPTCQKALDELGEMRQAFHASHDRAAFLAGVRQTAENEPRESLLAWILRPRGLALAGGAAAFLMVTILVLTQIPKETSGTRLKGAELELGYLVMENNHPVLAEKDRVLHPGERIQFRLSAPPGGFVHIVGVDTAGQVSVYFPLPDQENESYPGGSGRVVPGSVVLDATLGRERVFALVCDQPMDRKDLVQKIQAMHRNPRVLIDRDALPLNCRQTSLVLVKK